MSRETGLSKPTVSLTLAGLRGAGLVHEVGKATGGKGPGAVLYELNPQAGWVVGIDVGREWVRAAIADITGSIVARRDERARVRSAGTLIGQIGAIAHELAAEAGLRWKQVTHVTVGSPGVFDPARGLVNLAPNLPGWGRQGLVEAVQEQLGPNVSFENDVNLAAIGERWRGHGRDVENFVYLWVGTGVGMGLVLNGQLYSGANGAAGEAAYMPLGTADPHDATARRRGAFEEAAAGAAVVRVARTLGMTSSPLTAKKVFAAARRGDPAAAAAVETEAARIALGIATVAAVLDPELVILGGGVGRNGDLLLEPIGTCPPSGPAWPSRRWARTPCCTGRSTPRCMPPGTACSRGRRRPGGRETGGPGGLAEAVRRRWRSDERTNERRARHGPAPACSPAARRGE